MTTVDLTKLTTSQLAEHKRRLGRKIEESLEWTAHRMKVGALRGELRRLGAHADTMLADIRSRRRKI